MPIHHRHQIHKSAAFYANVGDVCAPYLIGSVDLDVLEKVGVYRILCVGNAGVDPFWIDVMSHLPQMGGQFGASVVGTFCVFLQHDLFVYPSQNKTGSGCLSKSLWSPIRIGSRHDLKSGFHFGTGAYSPNENSDTAFAVGRCDGSGLSIF